MDAVRKLILEKLLELRLSMSEASIKIGRNHAYLQQFLKRGIPIQLGEDERAALAELLNVPSDLLRGQSPRLPAKEYARLSPQVPNHQPVIKLSNAGQKRIDTLTHVNASFGEADLPVFGTANAGAGGALLLTNEAVDWVFRPAPLLRVREAYAMIVTGDSMSPRVENGFTMLMNPHLPPRGGDLCIFRNHQQDGTVLVLLKELRRFTDETWYVRQLHPRHDFTLKRSEWQICHVAIGSYFGR